MKLPNAIGFLVAGLTLAVVGAGAQSAAPPHDTFYFIGAIKKASIVMLAESAIVPRPLASRVARGIRTAIDSQSVPGAPRPTDYVDFEPMVIAAAGPDASRMHAGRSRQDIDSTYQRDYAREALLSDFEALNESRAKLLALARAHVDTIVPAYTLERPSAADVARALSLGHGAGARSRQRAAARIVRVRKPQPARCRGVIETSYDANHMSSVDFATELVNVLATPALHRGQLSQDLPIQYHDPLPWITIKDIVRVAALY